MGVEGVNEIIRFALLGLGVGALYAFASPGLIVIFRGTGVLNFSLGATGIAGVFLQYELQYERGQNFWVASFFGVLLSITLGVLTHWVILRPLQRKRASNLIQLLATLGVLVTVQAGGDPVRVKARQVPSQLPVDRVTLYGDVSITVDRLILLAIGSFSAFLFWLLYRSSNLVSKPRRFRRTSVLQRLWESRRTKSLSLTGVLVLRPPASAEFSSSR